MTWGVWSWPGRKMMMAWVGCLGELYTLPRRRKPSSWYMSVRAQLTADHCCQVMERGATSRDTEGGDRQYAEPARTLCCSELE